MPEKKIPLYIIAGPTAVGKSALGVELAHTLGGEIISADSMQVYKYMDIGTAKIMPDEMKGIKHHLIDILDPKEPFHVVDFKNKAKQAVHDIWGTGKVPIVVGGTGFYVQALLYDIDFADEGADLDLRTELEDIAREQGNDALHKMLEKLDPETAQSLHPNNVKRVIRAIEFAKLNSARISEHNKEQRARTSPYDFKYFVLNDDRSLVYDRIDKRVDKMIDSGLVDEVKWLVEYGCKPDMTSMQGIGYKQILSYLNGEYDLDEAIRIVKRDSRHYAKRQLTWFNRESDLHWIDRREMPNTTDQIRYCKEIIRK